MTMLTLQNVRLIFVSRVFLARISCNCDDEYRPPALLSVQDFTTDQRYARKCKREDVRLALF